MKIYIQFIKNKLQASMTYRSDLVISTVASLIKLFIQVFLWTALYNGKLQINSNSGIITIKEMITYSILSTGISVFTGNGVIYMVSEKIKSGEIAMDLIKPFSFKSLLLCETIATNISTFFIKFIPILSIGIIIFGFNIPPWRYIVLFIITVVNSMLINYMICYLLGLVAFWYLNTWQFDRLLRSSIMAILSGSFLPLWFLPKVVSDISGYLPFRHIFFTPISVYLGKVDLQQALVLIVQQILWVGILTVIERVIWNKGTKKLVIQGG